MEAGVFIWDEFVVGSQRRSAVSNTKNRLFVPNPGLDIFCFFILMEYLCILKNQRVKSIYIFFILSFLFIIPAFSCGTTFQNDTLKKKSSAAQPKKNISVKTFQNQDKTWGYKILINGKLYVNQPHIPAVPGTKGFASESDAKKCAGVMKKKIEKNMMPPTVEIKDLDSLKIKYK
jgi:hypothetical protein